VKLKPTQIAVSLGLLAGSLTLAGTAQAQINVTGGRVAGDAAFVTPLTITPGTTPGTVTGVSRSGTPVFFDTAIRTLNIVTPNGTSTNSRFLPTASSFTDTNGNSIPDSGDTGKLQGLLSGVAFSGTGSPIFFQGIPTNFSFTLNTFAVESIAGGTLISPKQVGTAPLVFLPVPGVTLTGDSIALPSNVKFQAGGDVPLPVIELGRRIKFEFKGENVTPGTDTDVNPLDGEIAFNGPVSKFEVKTIGTQGSQEFKFEGTTAFLNFELAGPFREVKIEGIPSNTARTTYELKGESVGYTAFGGNTLGFTGRVRPQNTEFKFEQSGAKVEGKGGTEVVFTLGSTPNFDSFTPVPQAVINSFSYPVGSTFSSTAFSTTTVISTTTVTSTSSSSSSQSISLFSNPSATYISLFDPVRFEQIQGNTGDDDDDDDDGDDDDDDDNEYGSNVVYQVYRPGAVVVVVERVGNRIILVERESTRGRALGKRGRVISAYEQVGLPSRVFPGLTGLRQIPASSVPTSTTEGTTTPSTTEGTTTTPGSTTPAPTTPQ